MDINVTHLMPETPGQPYVTSERPVGHGMKPPRPNSKRCRHSMHDSNKKLYPPEPHMPLVAIPIKVEGELAFEHYLERFLAENDVRFMSTIDRLKESFFREFTDYLKDGEMNKNTYFYPQFFIIAFAKEVAKRYANAMHPLGVSIFLQDIIQTAIQVCTQNTYCVVSKMLQHLDEYITPVHASMLICMLQEFQVESIHPTYFFAADDAKQKMIHHLTEETERKAMLIKQLRPLLGEEEFMRCIVTPPPGHETDYLKLDHEYMLVDYLHGKMCAFLL